jgi:hypothetical protein
MAETVNATGPTNRAAEGEVCGHMEIRTVRGQQIHPVRQGGGQPEPRPGDRLLPQRCGLVGGHRDPGTLRRGTGLTIETQGTRPYFEVLLVEDMPDTQERALREELRKWRRPDDELACELVIVHDVEDAFIAARLTYNIQACVIRRRFEQRSGRDLSALSQFIGEGHPRT